MIKLDWENFTPRGYRYTDLYQLELKALPVKGIFTDDILKTETQIMPGSYHYYLDLEFQP